MQNFAEEIKLFCTKFACFVQKIWLQDINNP